MYHELSSWISYGVAVLVCGFAIWKGDRWARFVGAVFLAGWTITPFIMRHDPLNPDVAVLTLDVVVMLLMVWTTLKARKLWAACAAACQMMAVASQVVTFIDLRIYIATLILGLTLWSHLVLVALLFATVSAIRARRSADERRA